MNSREKKDRTLYSCSLENEELESPFLEEELFTGESETDWEQRLASLEAESPFGQTFGQRPLEFSEQEETEFTDQVIENLERLKKTYDEIRGVAEKYKEVNRLIFNLTLLEWTRKQWMRDPENLGKGIAFARKTSEGIAALKFLVPDSLPGPVKEYLNGLFEAVPNYVNALTGLLEKRIRTIDNAVSKAEGAVKFGSASCTNGNINSAGVKVIKQLDLDQDTKQKIFRTACQWGLRRALRKHLGTKFVREAAEDRGEEEEEEEEFPFRYAFDQDRTGLIEPEKLEEEFVEEEERDDGDDFPVEEAEAYDEEEPEELEDGSEDLYDDDEAPYTEEEEEALSEDAISLEEEPLIPAEVLIELEEKEDAPLSDLQQRIVEIAKREWNNWEQGNLSEIDPKATPFLQKYWRTYRPKGLSQSKVSRMIEERRAWSAVFISYVMREAGAGAAFSYSALHTTYIAAAKKAAEKLDASKFQAYDISAVRPEVGDLVCRDRAPKTGAPCTRTNFDNVDKGGISHSDIVVDVFPHHIIILGGNTGQTYPERGQKTNTVGQRKINLDDQGLVIPVQRKGACRYFAIVKPPSLGASLQTQPILMPTPKLTPGSAKPSTELVCFAQRVLNAAEGERLKVDGDLGPLTRGALERFRKNYNLGAGGALDDKTQLALAQRALEEIRQQSLFAQPGVHDAVTREALSSFKSEHGLGTDATLDASTRAALADALGAATMPTRQPTPGAAKVSKSGGKWGGWRGRQTTSTAFITPSYIRDKYDLAVAVAAKVEGAFDKVQMYDKGILSWGIKQWTLHRGSLQKVLGFIKSQLDKTGQRSLWTELFPGIDIQGNRFIINGAAYSVPKKDNDEADRVLRKIFRGTERPEDFNKDIMDHWLDILALAGRHPNIRKLQFEYAVMSLKKNLNKHLGEVLKARKDIKESEVNNYRRVGDYVESSSVAIALFNGMETQSPQWTYRYLKRIVDRFSKNYGTYDTSQWPSGWQEQFAEELKKEFQESKVACWGTKALETKPACKGRTSRTEKILRAYKELS